MIRDRSASSQASCQRRRRVADPFSDTLLVVLRKVAGNIAVAASLGPNLDFGHSAFGGQLVGEHRPDLGRFDGGEGDRIGHVAGRAWRVLGSRGDVLPLGTVPILDRIAFGFLDPAAIVVNVKDDASGRLRLAEIDFQPIGSTGRFIAGPTVDRIGCEDDSAVDRVFGRAAETV